MYHIRKHCTRVIVYLLLIDWLIRHSPAALTLSSACRSKFSMLVMANDYNWSLQEAGQEKIAIITTCPYYKNMVKISKDWITDLSCTSSYSPGQSNELRFIPIKGRWKVVSWKVCSNWLWFWFHFFWNIKVGQWWKRAKFIGPQLYFVLCSL